MILYFIFNNFLFPSPYSQIFFSVKDRNGTMKWHENALFRVRSHDDRIIDYFPRFLRNERYSKSPIVINSTRINETGDEERNTGSYENRKILAEH